MKPPAAGIDPEVDGSESVSYTHLDVYKRQIHARKYFYPLISWASCYSASPSAAGSNLPVAERVSRQVLCLPIYGSLEAETVRSICGTVAEAREIAAPAIAGLVKS